MKRISFLLPLLLLGCAAATDPALPPAPVQRPADTIPSPVSSVGSSASTADVSMQGEGVSGFVTTGVGEMQVHDASAYWDAQTQTLKLYLFSTPLSPEERAMMPTFADTVAIGRNEMWAMLELQFDDSTLDMRSLHSCILTTVNQLSSEEEQAMQAIAPTRNAIPTKTDRIASDCGSLASDSMFSFQALSLSQSGEFTLAVRSTESSGKKRQWDIQLLLQDVRL